MTDADIRQQKAMLLLECQEAEQKLANLQECAHQAVDSFNELGSWLERLIQETENQPAGEISERMSLLEANEKKYRDHLSLDLLKQLERDLAQAANRVRRLRQRKDSLGLR